MATILLPVKASATSQNTLEWAARFFQPERNRMILLHVLPKNEDSEANRQAALNLLEEMAGRLAGYHYTGISRLIETGPVVDTICQVADAHHADQIVLGTNSRFELAERLLEGVYREVMARARQPVLLLRHPENPELEITHSREFPTQALAAYTRRILIPIDGSPGSRQTMNWAARHLNPARTEILLLTVMDYQPLFPPGMHDYDEALLLLEQGREWFEQRDFQVESAHYIVDEVVQGIVSYAKSRDVGSILIGTHGDKSLNTILSGSVSSRVFESAAQPVILLRNDPPDSLKISHANRSNARWQLSYVRLIE